jgi:hypothetical protein
VTSRIESLVAHGTALGRIHNTADVGLHRLRRAGLPFRFTPDKTSSVVEVAPNGVASSIVIFHLLVLNRSM